jgi:hypothetical protein
MLAMFPSKTNVGLFHLIVSTIRDAEDDVADGVDRLLERVPELGDERVDLEGSRHVATA